MGRSNTVMLEHQQNQGESAEMTIKLAKTKIAKINQRLKALDTDLALDFILDLSEAIERRLVVFENEMRQRQKQKDGIEHVNHE